MGNQDAPPPPPPPPPSYSQTHPPPSTIKRGINDSPKNGTSVLSSCNSSFVTYDTETADIRNLVLVDDDTTTQATPRESLRLSMLAHSQDLREASLSPPGPPSKGTLQTQPCSHYSLLDHSMTVDEDSFLQGHNANHERADFVPVRPNRGASVCNSSIHSESFKSNPQGPYIYLNPNNPSASHNYHRHSSSNRDSITSSVPSMWEDSWTTYTSSLDNSHRFPIQDSWTTYTNSLDNSHRFPIQEEEAEDPMVPPKAAAFQQMSLLPQNQNLTPPERRSSGRTKSPTKRTSSKNSQYTDPSNFKRTSRNQRISRLKQKKVSSPISTLSKSIANNNEISSHHSNESFSHNSTQPVRRSTKLLPPDEEAEAEPDSFFEHSESQLSLTSSEEEEEYMDDKMPQIPDRRTSASSVSLAEQVRVGDQPLAAPLRRTSTFGSTSLDPTTECHPYDLAGDQPLSAPRRQPSTYSTANNNNGPEQLTSDRIAAAQEAYYDRPIRAPLRRTSTFGSTTLDPSTVVECLDEEDWEEDDDEKLPPSSIRVPSQDDDDDLPISSIQLTTAAEVDHVPTLPARQRSIPQRLVKEEWLNRQTAWWSSESEGELIEDVTPSKPKRQTTIDKEDAVRQRAMRKHVEGLCTAADDPDSGIPSKPRRQITMDDEEDAVKRAMPNHVWSLIASTADSVDTSSPRDGLTTTTTRDNFAAAPEKDSEEKENASQSPNPSARINPPCPRPPPVHHRATSDGKPNIPTRQLSKLSRCLSPLPPDANFSNSEINTDESEKSLLLETSTTQPGDDPSPCKPCPICEAQEQSSTTMLQSSITSCVSSATTHVAGNIKQREPERRSPPCRHFTRGASLRSAAESLQQRESSTSSMMDETAVVGVGATMEALLSPSGELEQLKLANEAAAAAPPLSQTSELEQLKMLNEMLSENSAQKLQDQLECLNIDDASVGTSNKAADLSVKSEEETQAPSSPSTELEQLKLANEAAMAPLSPTSELEQLKMLNGMLNNDSAKKLQEQLDCLKFDEASCATGNNSNNNNSTDSIKAAADLGAKSEETLKAHAGAGAVNNGDSPHGATNQLSGSNHTEAESSVWTSASKEFEHLKSLYDDLAANDGADLERRLQLLEQQEGHDLYNGSGSIAAGVSSSTGLDASGQGSDRFDASATSIHGIRESKSAGEPASLFIQDQSNSSVECAL